MNKKINCRPITGKIGMFNSMAEQRRMSNDFSISHSPKKTIWQTPHIEPFKRDELGGIITFSTDVNNTYCLTESGFFDVLKHKLSDCYLSHINQIQKRSKIYNLLHKNEQITGLTIGNYLNGQYKSRSGKLFNHSLCVEVIGVNTETLNQFAAEICQAFNQESVLVKNYTTNEIYLIKLV